MIRKLSIFLLLLVLFSASLALLACKRETPSPSSAPAVPPAPRVAAVPPPAPGAPQPAEKAAPPKAPTYTYERQDRP
ncbi:MAG: hypothetical protein QHH30_00695, partial [candidate division NC10 bacterium]|nr:hypothetical protein [candidate division NC10 bacterium]